MLKQLKYFQSVVRLGSFSAAAEENFISQSAISQQVQSLERELGFALLVRKNRSFSLTPAGEYFYRKSLLLTADCDRMCAEAARALGDWDAEIVETHHNQKADAPSGTAKLLLEAIDPAGEAPVAYGREGMVGARPAGEVGMHSLRGGTVAGTHEVHFFGPDEEVCLTHRATSRQIFVNGAVACAQRLMARPVAGFYTFDQLMFD